MFVLVCRSVEKSDFSQSEQIVEKSDLLPKSNSPDHCVSLLHALITLCLSSLTYYVISGGCSLFEASLAFFFAGSSSNSSCINDNYLQKLHCCFF